MTTQFSPDGRLYQVEYALETVRRGGLVVGVRARDGVVLAARVKRGRLQSALFGQKIFQVDDHISAAASGCIPDARVQVERARVIAQSLRVSYDEDASVVSVTKHVADVNQMFTQYGGVRPFAATVIFGGVDETGLVLSAADPSGMYSTYDAVAVGSGSDRATDYLERHYHDELTLDDACRLAIACIHLAYGKVQAEEVEVAVVELKRRKMRPLPHKEVEALMGRRNGS